MTKIWMATNDERTRIEHELLDGQEIGVDDVFEVDGYKIEYPGDPSADPRMVYNCRCALKTRVAGFKNHSETKTETQQENFRKKSETTPTKFVGKELTNQITSDFRKHGGVIVDNEEAAEHLRRNGATACYWPGTNTMLLNPDHTISDLLEETYHAKQDRKEMFICENAEETYLRREIDAQEYLIKCEKRFNIPEEEKATTRSNLEAYKEKLERLLR